MTKRGSKATCMRATVTRTEFPSHVVVRFRGPHVKARVVRAPPVKPRMVPRRPGKAKKPCAFVVCLKCLTRGKLVVVVSGILVNQIQ